MGQHILTVGDTINLYAEDCFGYLHSDQSR